MDILKHWVSRHQLIAFFLITFGISWGLGFSYYAINVPGQELLFPLAAVATCGPALAGIIVTRLSSTGQKRGSSRSFWIAFPLALVVSSAVFLAHNVIVNGVALNPIMVVFLVVFSIPVAYVLSSAFSRSPAVRRYLASVSQVRRVWPWLLLAPVVMLGLDLLSIWISNLLGRGAVTLADLPSAGLDTLKIVAIIFLYQLFFFNLSGEEIGWRGFALPRLLARTNLVAASLVLTFFWAVWHAFYWGAAGEPVMTWRYWLDTFIRLFPATVLINWLTIRSGGSILVAGVTHAFANTFFTLLTVIDWPVHTATLYGAALLILLVERQWRKLPSGHPAVSQMPVSG